MKPYLFLAAIILQICTVTTAAWGQMYTRILSPVYGQCVTGPDVRVQFEAGGVTLAPGGYNLHIKLNDEPFHVKYRGNYAHVFKNVPTGTHTVRMYLANSIHEAVPGTLSTVTFSVAHGDHKNVISPGQPYLTWNLPQGEYLGADATDITLDFLLSNATLSPGGLQVAYYVNGRRFLIQDNCWRRHITNLEPGLHRIKIELQDANGDLIPGPFNSGERIIAVSPHTNIPSTPVSADAYWNAPRLQSIPGRATMGGTRPVVLRQLTETERQRQQSLIINRGGERIRPDGSTISEDITPGRATDLDRPALTSDVVGFTVREGGVPDADSSTDLDAVESDNVVRGSVSVRRDETDDADDDDDDDAPTREATSVRSQSAGPSGTASPATTTRDSSSVTTSETEDDDDATTAPSIRRRADGTVVPVEGTTETLRLSDRPTLRQSDIDTTRTVTGSAITTASAVTTGSAVSNGRITTETQRRTDRATTPTTTGAPVVTGATPEPAVPLTGTPANDIATESSEPSTETTDDDADTDQAAEPALQQQRSEDADDTNGTTERTVRDRAPRRELPSDAEEGRSTRGRRDRDEERGSRRGGSRDANTTREGYRPPVSPDSDQ